MAEIHLPTIPTEAAVSIEATEASRWQQGAYTVWHLSGNVQLGQGKIAWHGTEAIVWVEQPASFDQPTKLIVYLEGTAEQPVKIELLASEESSSPIARQQTPQWFGRLYTMAGVDWQTPEPETTSVDKPQLFTRALARFAQEAPGLDETPRRDEKVKPAQFAAPFLDSTAPTPEPYAPDAASFRTIELYPRQGAGLQGEYLTTPSGESVGVLSGGLNLVITGVQAPGLPLGGNLGDGIANGQVDRIDLEADRAVIWTAGSSVSAGSFQQSGDSPFEVYLEGNIVFRQGDRTVYAERMYYDARRHTGVILDAELLTPLPSKGDHNYRGLVRLKAAAIRQLDDSRFVATDALFTTSRLEEPSYSLRSGQITFEDYQQPLIDPRTGQPATDPFTGAPLFEHRQLATSESNSVYLGNTPMLYWPTFATDLKEPSFYISDFRIRNDSIFGFQVLADFDVYQLLGAKAPEGTNWDVGFDYLSDRGLGYGTTYDYDTDYFLGATGPAIGQTDLWFIDERGNDNLGFGRRNIVPEKSYRGRAYWSHQQRVTNGLLAGWTVQGEVGWISDRTFLEQYYENEWDEHRDQPTGFRLRRRIDNQSLTIESNVRLNDFFTETQWLPRLDHYLMGQDLLDETFTWFAHSHVGYAKLKPSSTPSNPILAGQHFPFPWEANVEGERVATRQEIDFPIDLTSAGTPIKIVPYFMGELAHWGEDLTGQDLQRAYMQTGVRASLPMWAVNPHVRDPLFNLNGLAHKVVFDAELSYADSSRDYDELPLYDAIEDNALEEIRRRMFFPTIPIASDPRFYLIRSGIQSYVASPTTELVDDLSVARVGMRHRLQTKRGAPGQERVVDWLTLDANASYFPEENRDNLGEDFGLIDYDMQWHVGDRVTILSDGFIDLFGDGLNTFSAGVALNRPARGNAYIGYRSIRGPFNSDLFTARVNYRLNEKWLMSAAAVIDFGNTGNIGQTFSLSRIGESLIVTVGANVDESKGNTGFSFLVEPRFLPKTSLTRKTGVDIPPAGAFGLE